MGPTPDEVEEQIEGRRDDLKSNLHELEDRVRSAVDWRHYFREHPFIVLGAAFGVGVLLSHMTRSTSPGVELPRLNEESLSAIPGTRSEVLEHWDDIVSGLVGAASHKLKGFLSDTVPGFADRLDNDD